MGFSVTADVGLDDEEGGAKALAESSLVVVEESRIHMQRCIDSIIDCIAQDDDMLFPKPQNFHD